MSEVSRWLFGPVTRLPRSPFARPTDQEYGMVVPMSEPENGATWKLLWRAADADAAVPFLLSYLTKIGIVDGRLMSVCVCVWVCVWARSFLLIFAMHAWKLFSFCSGSEDSGRATTKAKGCWQRQETVLWIMMLPTVKCVLWSQSKGERAAKRPYIDNARQRCSSRY